MTHGTRKAYKLGCRCLLCKAANADYQRQLYAASKQGKPPLGSYVPASEVWRRIKQLKAERVSRALLAKQRGLKRAKLDVHPERVRLKTLLRFRRWTREYLTVHGAQSETTAVHR